MAAGQAAFSIRTVYILAVSMASGNSNGPQDSIFRSLAILHLAMLMGQLLFAAVVCILVFSGNLAPVIDDSQNIQILVGAIALAAIGGSQAIFNSRLSAARDKSTNDEKLSTFKTAFVLRNAVLELGALAPLVLFMLTGTMAYFYIAVALIIWFAFQFPVRSKILSAINIDELSPTQSNTGDRF